ncbi:MAG: hypothetical protein JO128_12710 [Alphaproteobacteria bacterium]|nr:hypothetical protein [Alphaproteobacteria bacterium]
MSVHKAKFRTAAALALILGASTLAGCVYEQPAPAYYPNYAAAYPGYYPNYYGYPEYSVGEARGLAAAGTITITIAIGDEWGGDGDKPF